MMDTHPGADLIDIRVLADWLNDLESTENPTEDDLDEINALHELQNQFGHSLYEQGNNHQPTMVLDDYFVIYAQTYHEDSLEYGKVTRWPHNHIDWDEAAEELQADYTEYQYGGYTYWVR